MQSEKKCDVNKLSINRGKTNFMIIKSTKKNGSPINLNTGNSDGSSYTLERKQCIKYPGVIMDESLSWKHQISFVCSPISRNTVKMLKLRYYLSIKPVSYTHLTLPTKLEV